MSMHAFLSLLGGRIKSWKTSAMPRSQTVVSSCSSVIHVFLLASRISRCRNLCSLLCFEKIGTTNMLVLYIFRCNSLLYIFLWVLAVVSSSHESWRSIYITMHQQCHLWEKAKLITCPFWWSNDATNTSHLGVINELTTSINYNRVHPCKLDSFLLSFVIECMPLSISMGNAIRFLKNNIAKVPHRLWSYHIDC